LFEKKEPFTFCNYTFNWNFVLDYYWWFHGFINRYSEITASVMLSCLLLQVGTGLRDRDFHAGGSRRSRPSDDLHIPRPSGQTKDNKYSWEEAADPYSVLNVYARQHRTQGMMMMISRS